MKTSLALVVALSFGAALGALPAAAGGNVAVNTAVREFQMTPTQKRALDTFFSNFSEAALPNFTHDGLSDKILIDFGVQHTFINNSRALAQSARDDKVKISHAQVDQAAVKYFGRPVKTHTEAVYTLPAASGEAYTFSQIDSLADLGGARYLAKGTVYVTSSGFTGDPHAAPAVWKRAGEHVDVGGKFTATVKATEGRYILIDYEVARSS